MSTKSTATHYGSLYGVSVSFYSHLNHVCTPANVSSSITTSKYDTSGFAYATQTFLHITMKWSLLFPANVLDWCCWILISHKAQWKVRNLTIIDMTMTPWNTEFLTERVLWRSKHYGQWTQTQRSFDNLCFIHSNWSKCMD